LGANAVIHRSLVHIVNPARGARCGTKIYPTEALLIKINKKRLFQSGKKKACLYSNNSDIFGTENKYRALSIYTTSK